MTPDLRHIRDAARRLAATTEKERNVFLAALEKEIGDRADDIIGANARDVADAKAAGLAKVFIQRLVLDRAGIVALQEKLRSTRKLKSGIREVIEEKRMARGLIIKKVRVPLGVILAIYESRPEVTIDTAALCVKSGNAAILKGGSEAHRTNEVLHACIRGALDSCGLPADTISPVQDRAGVMALLRKSEHIDLVIARGGYGLVKTIKERSTIPVLAHAAGGARIFVDASADAKMAERIIVNAKTGKPAACNSLDTVLVHAAIADSFVPSIAAALAGCGVSLRGDARACALAKGITRARSRDWGEESLGLSATIAVVGGADAAAAFIARYGKGHSEGIIASDERVIERFVKSVDTAAVFVNASTRLHDGYVFGFGSEMGIATGKLHARGPVGLQGLTTYTWEVYGSGNIR